MNRREFVGTVAALAVVPALPALPEQQSMAMANGWTINLFKTDQQFASDDWPKGNGTEEYDLMSPMIFRKIAHAMVQH